MSHYEVSLKDYTFVLSPGAPRQSVLEVEAEDRDGAVAAFRARLGIGATIHPFSVRQLPSVEAVEAAIAEWSEPEPTPPAVDAPAEE